MPVSFYDASIASYIQSLDAVGKFLEKSHAHCVEKGIDPQEIVTARIHPDMLPFSFQVISIAHHSGGAVEAVKSGSFAPPKDPGTLDWNGLAQLVSGARAALGAVDRAAFEAGADNDIVFKLGERAIPFKAGDFILSFSLPNFYFHVTTAYDILRGKGVPLGKRDYLGMFRMKR
jgi:hypothetical protein